MGADLWRQHALIILVYMAAHTEPMHEKINGRAFQSYFSRQLPAIKRYHLLHGSKVVLGMGVRQAESDIDIALPINIRSTISVADNFNLILGSFGNRRFWLPISSAHPQ